MEDAIKRFTLELDRNADPIAGRLVDDGGERHPFAGWLGLAAALEHFGNSEQAEGNGRDAPPAK